MSDKNPTTSKPPLEVVDQRGPWPFVTLRVLRSADGIEQLWNSRHHRKGLLVRGAGDGERLASVLSRCIWMPGQLNWWIGNIFALGSLLFAVASLLSLMPKLAMAWSLNSTQINALFFIGSIPFTIAAYLQLFQAANAGEFDATGSASASRLRLLGWRPQSIGWLSCALQFVGTLLFNFNTWDAMLPSLAWFQQDLLIWAPNIIGSILFLGSGYLAFIETCHAFWAWNPNSISWWVVSTNLLGCVGFMISAMLAIFLPGTPDIEVVHVSIYFTLFGAIGFLIGSALMLPETVSAEPQSAVQEPDRGAQATSR